MSVLSDKWIKKMSKEHRMISPFEEKQVRGDSISYGLSSFGYDARVSDEFKIFTNVNSEIVDPKNFKPTNFVTKKVSECIIPPNSFVLARTVEEFIIPNDVLVICLGKSTYARCGIIVNVTPLEPGWEGYVTLNFLTQLLYQQKFMLMRELLNSYFSREMKNQILPTLTEMVSIWVRLVLHCLKFKHAKA